MSTNRPTNRTIRLIVQANKLMNSSVTDEDIDNYTSLVVDNGTQNGFGAPNQDFETIVFMNKNICWSIEMANINNEDEHYSVSLSKVIHKPDAGNPNFFTTDPLLVNEATGQVCGTIALNPNLPNKDDSYTIEFAIGYSNRTPQGGVTTGMILIKLDPKLRISPGS